MTARKFEEKPACSVKSAPAPVEVPCPDCGTENEIWSDETGTTCSQCGSLVHKSCFNVINY